MYDVYWLEDVWSLQDWNTLSQGMLKLGDVNNDADDDDEVRSRVSQTHATATLSTEQVFLWIQYL